MSRPIAVRVPWPMVGSLLDYGDVIVHIFSTEQRDYYRLEQLWEHAHLVVRVQ